MQMSQSAPQPKTIWYFHGEGKSACLAALGGLIALCTMPEPEEEGETLEIPEETPLERQMWREQRITIHATLVNDPVERHHLNEIFELETKCCRFAEQTSRCTNVQLCRHNLDLFVAYAEQAFRYVTAIMKHNARLAPKKLLPSWKQVGRTQAQADFREIKGPLEYLEETMGGFSNNLDRIANNAIRAASELSREASSYIAFARPRARSMERHSYEFEKLACSAHEKAARFRMSFREIIDRYFDEIIVDETSQPINIRKHRETRFG